MKNNTLPLFTILIGLAGCATVKEFPQLKDEDNPSASLVFAYNFQTEILFAQQYGCYLYLESVATGATHTLDNQRLSKNSSNEGKPI